MRVFTVGKLREPLLHTPANDNAPPLGWRVARLGRWTARRVPGTWPWLLLGLGGTTLLFALQ